jgi:hypothetical protein
MAKLFSTRTHGVLDYVTVAQLLTIPRMFGWSKGATQWMTGMGLGTLANSLVTRYEYGPLKLWPVSIHLGVDFMQGVMFCAFPLLFPKESTAVKATVVGMGLFEIAASLSTETEPSYSEQAAYFVEDTADRVQDGLQGATDNLNERTIGA